ncbi:MAG: protein-L-isoaspartate(D-aspartate) O-methyltransferase [Acidobacteriota bacterium]|nr:protein-L-isoaspartate(D-aspartate) O-methyltransferase [Acidobacteriota bacterium]
MSTEYMVETQIKPRGVTNPEVLRAMRTVSRDLFVPENYRNLAFSDCPLPIPKGQTISQPYMVAAMTELLAIDSTSKVLEIGTGSGYQTAVLAEIAAEVYTVEIVESLGIQARNLLTGIGYTNIHFRLGDGYFGWPENGPYDAVIVTAAPEEVPATLLAQMSLGARMVIPVGPHAESQTLRLIQRTGEDQYLNRDVMAVRFVPLTGDHSQPPAEKN